MVNPIERYRLIDNKNYKIYSYYQSLGYWSLLEDHAPILRVTPLNLQSLKIVSPLVNKQPLWFLGSTSRFNNTDLQKKFTRQTGKGLLQLHLLFSGNKFANWLSKPTNCLSKDRTDVMDERPNKLHPLLPWSQTFCHQVSGIIMGVDVGQSPFIPSSALTDKVERNAVGFLLQP